MRDHGAAAVRPSSTYWFCETQVSSRRAAFPQFAHPRKPDLTLRYSQPVRGPIAHTMTDDRFVSDPPESVPIERVECPQCTVDGAISLLNTDCVPYFHCRKCGHIWVDRAHTRSSLKES